MAQTLPYNLDTFSGRLFHFVRLTSPLNLLATDSDIKHAKDLLSTYTTNPSAFPSTLLPQLWDAKYKIDATIHPDTHEKIFLPFRMSAFVPTNLIVTIGLLLPNPSVRSLIFWQWVNQSVNVGINWANANKTTEMSMQETALAYGTAVGSSVAIAVGLGRFVNSTSLLNGSSRLFLSRFVPFVAVASAGTLNVFLMRRKELVDGIDVRDEDGKVVGKSQVAGWKAVSQVAVSRIATAFPCLTLPPLILSQLEHMDFFKKSSWRIAGANFALITICLLTALPAAIALFPQTGKISSSELEPIFHGMKRKDGSQVKELTYNKGL